MSPTLEPRGCLMLVVSAAGDSEEGDAEELRPPVYNPLASDAAPPGDPRPMPTAMEHVAKAVHHARDVFANTKDAIAATSEYTGQRIGQVGPGTPRLVGGRSVGGLALS